ncbi:MAG: Gx transporter family protein [Sphaerochaeta sp.]
MSQTERKIAFIGATTLLLSSVEYLIPKPLPFLRLGLANLPLLIILESMGWKAYLFILLLKAIGQGMVSGTLFSYLFLISLAGTLSSGIAMKAVKLLLKSKVSLVGISLVGAFVSNLAQLAVAALVAYGPSIWVAAPLMLTLGLLSSFALGLLAEIYVQKSSFAHSLDDESINFALPAVEQGAYLPRVAIASLLCIAAILFTQTLFYLAPLTLCMYLLQLTARRKIRLLPPLMLLVSLAILSLFEPNGKVLLSLGSVAFTEGSLTLAFTKALRLMSLLAASQCLTASNPRLKGKAGSILLLDLAYFGQLSSSFRTTKGSLVKRIDQALQSAASGNGTEQAVQKQQKRAIKEPLFLLLSGCVLFTALLSNILK